MNRRAPSLAMLMSMAVVGACGPGGPNTGAECASWSRPFYGTQIQSAAAVTHVGSCDTVVAGTLAGESSFDSEVIPSNWAARPPYRLYLARLSGRGNIVWKKIVGPGGEYPLSNLRLLRHPSGDLILGGEIYGPHDFDGRALAPEASDWFVSRLTAEGSIVFARTIGGPGRDRLEAIAAAPDGSLLLAGDFIGGVQVDGQRLAAGGALVRLDPMGAYLGDAPFPGARVRAVDVNDEGQVAVLVETVGACGPCGMGPPCGHQCPASATTIIQRLGTSLQFGPVSGPVATEGGVLVDTGPRWLDLRWTNDDNFFLLVAGRPSASIRRYGPGGELLKQQDVGPSAGLFVPRIVVLPSGGVMLANGTPPLTALELDSGLGLVRSGAITAGGLLLADFAVDRAGGLLLAGTISGVVDVAGTTWDPQGSQGSFVARIEPALSASSPTGVR